MSTSKTRPAYRDSRTGLFITQQQANRRDRSNWQKERVPVAGRGDTNRGKSK